MKRKAGAREHGLAKEKKYKVELNNEMEIGGSGAGKHQKLLNRLS
jgi:hypothetical protein